MLRNPDIANPADAALYETLKGFSYSYPGDPLWKRIGTRLIEIVSGQPFMIRLYMHFHKTKRPDEDPFSAGLRVLQIDAHYDAAKLANWPQSGPLVILCNHPFGIIDGLIACQFAYRTRKDFRILTNAILNRAEELRPFLLPVDFSGTAESTRINLASRAAARTHLKAGGCVVVFPAGSVGITTKFWGEKTTDYPWKNFAARLIEEAEASVALVFFEGRNSRLFQLVSRISINARLPLYIREVRRMMGRRVNVYIGPVLSYAALAPLGRRGLLRHLRQRLYAIKK